MAKNKPIGNDDRTNTVDNDVLQCRNPSSCGLQESNVLPIPSRGAGLSFSELEITFPPQLPVPEERHCIIHPAMSTASLSTIRLKRVPSNKGLRRDPEDSDDDKGEIPAITLVKAGKNPTMAIGRISKPSIPLHHHERGWGEVWFGLAYPLSIREPTEGTFGAEYPPHRVAVKQLNKSVVTDYMLSDGPENPYKEISRLQEFKEESCILDCWEALEDCESLYIVSPYAAGGTLYDLAFSPFIPLFPARIHSIFVQLLRVLAFLEGKNIHHRDLSPDNCLLTDDGQVKVMDFALSMRIPVVNGQRTLIQNVGSFGTHAYMAPEIVLDDKFDGVAADLWSLMVILYNLVTRHKLYDRPLPKCDRAFDYFVVRRGMVSRTFNEAILNELCVGGQLRRQASAHLAWSEEIRELLGNTLRRDPRDRWTLSQVMCSNYVCTNPMS